MIKSSDGKIISLLMDLAGSNMEKRHEKNRK
ncbi:hypothetical protein AND4_17489 [Vibrio sp. AND4]|nr:hypothetical protein AND4_17489 [Vibrio sp. AND4]